MSLAASPRMEMLTPDSPLGKRNPKWAENPNQPVVQAHLISHRRNWLDGWNDSTSKEPEVAGYICPERMHISSVSTQHHCSGTISNQIV